MKKQNMLPQDAIEVGRIAGAWGIKGAVKIVPFSSEAEALFSCDQWYLVRPESALGPAITVPQSTKGRKNASAQIPDVYSAWPDVLHVKEIREQQNGIVAMAQEIPDRNMAETLKGGRIFISRSEFPELEEDEFYWVDLIGLDVVNLQGKVLGKVAGLMSNGPQSILQVAYTMADETGKNDEPKEAERLIPFVDAFIRKVDHETKMIHVDWQLDY